MELYFVVLRLWNKFCFCYRINPYILLTFTIAFFMSLAMTVAIVTVCLTSPKKSTKCELTFQRTMKSSLISGPQPRSVVNGDINNDYQIDFVVANSGTNTIGVFISQGNGIFANRQTYSTGSESRPYSVTISDFNNDTYADIVVANYGTNNIGLFLGYGNGTFDDQKLMSLGSSHPLFVTIGDFNKDNRMDIAVVNDGTNTIGILLGYGNGSFQQQETYFTGYDSFPSSLAVGDFNNDTHLDIVVSNSGTNNIGIFLNYGNGTFRNQQIYTTNVNSNPSSVAVGDFNNDSILDLVVANYGSRSVGIFFGHGTGTFLSQISYTIGSNAYPQYVTVSDMDKDNVLDIVIVDSQNAQIDFLPGYGNGSFATMATYDGVSGSMPVWITMDDFNNNNKSDVVVVNYGNNHVVVLMDYSAIPSVRQTNYYLGASSMVGSVVVSDFNDDGILDIVCNSRNSIVIFMGFGNSTFDRPKTYPMDDLANTQYVCGGDVNNDNRMDIIIADPGWVNGVDVFLGDGNGSFGSMTRYPTGNSSNPQWVAVGDLNDDNISDMVSCNQGTHSIGIFFGNGNGTFAPMLNYFTVDNSGLMSVAIGNINNDNHLDIAVLDENNRVFTFLGQGNTTFIMVTTNYASTHSNSAAFFLADLNKDNHLDIVIANTDEENVGVSLGYGNGTFAPQTIYSTGTGSKSLYVIVADCNNDNISDIIATAAGRGEVIIFYGYGNGSFNLSRNYPTGLESGPVGIAAADLNNDTHVEFVVALWGTGIVAILTEYYAAEFINKTIYSTALSPQPSSVAIADFNNDNRSDIVVANSGNDSLSIILGLSNGLFSMEMTYTIGTDSYPQYVITCDINKDNHIDIVSVNSKSDSISVIMGYGNGSFADQLTYSTGDNSSPYAVVSGDLNNDNQLDLVIANSGTDSIGILFGYDYTSFQSPQTYSSINTLAPWMIIVSDFNNDNILDVATAFHYSDIWWVLLGYGNGSFTIPKTYSMLDGAGPIGIDVGDFNNDNQSDIVIANYWGYNISVYLGYGNGSFSTIGLYSTANGSHPEGIAVGDFNNDSRLDIVIAIQSDNIGVFLGYGNGSFATMMTYSTGQGSYPAAVTVADFNNDGHLDIAVANYVTNNVGIFLGYGDGTFRNQVTFSSGDDSNPDWITVGDFNRDNLLDIATANAQTNDVGILSGYGNGSFATVVTYSAGDGSGPSCISVGDFNNDNISDIAVANYGTDSIVILFGLEDGSFLLGLPYSSGAGSEPVALANGDFNKDGLLDIAVANSDSNTISILLADDIQPFAGVTPYPTGLGSQPYSVALGDFNNDSWLDIVVGNYGDDTVGILLGSNNRTFSDIQTYPMEHGSAPYSVAVAYLDNDTYLDIVVTNSETNNIFILLGDGTGKFRSGKVHSTGIRSRPYAGTIGDFNNDNISDIAVANSGTSNVLVLYGHGDGTFGNDTFYLFGYEYQPYSIAVGHLNEDDWVDMAIACYDTNHVETLIKMC